ncbi:MAG TPA: hypothetical protein VNQ90_16425 [Chthoniobacteraceae bacterium]|nr:hypothetical protein [Chthoniobacteraceae bacterium]
MSQKLSPEQKALYRRVDEVLTHGGTLNMNQYILLIHGNAKSASSQEEWNSFFTMGRESGLFVGGSGIEDARIMIGDPTAKPSEHIVGYMRFDADDKQKVLDLLQKHPIVVHGGSVELCEMARE